MKKLDINNYDFTVNRPGGNIRPDKEYDYLEGNVSTKYGYVMVYTQGDQKLRHMTALWLIHNGRQYCRHINRRYSARGIVTKANRFAKEVSQMEPINIFP